MIDTTLKRDPSGHFNPAQWVWVQVTAPQHCCDGAYRVGYLGDLHGEVKTGFDTGARVTGAADMRAKALQRAREEAILAEAIQPTVYGPPLTIPVGDKALTATWIIGEHAWCVEIEGFDMCERIVVHPGRQNDGVQATIDEVKARLQDALLECAMEYHKYLLESTKDVEPEEGAVFARLEPIIGIVDSGEHEGEPVTLDADQQLNPYERFTDRARKVMQLANQEAQRFNHEYIGTEHILMGLIKEGSGVAANVLKNLDLDTRKIRLEVEKLVQSGPDMVTMGKLPLTPRAKVIVEHARREARELGDSHVGTEHLLLGTIDEKEGVAIQVLLNFGCTADAIRHEVLFLLGKSEVAPEVEEARKVIMAPEQLDRVLLAADGSELAGDLLEAICDICDEQQQMAIARFIADKATKRIADAISLT